MTGAVAAALLGACSSSDERQWMKVGQQYTTAEFQRDVKECTRGRKLDEACMQDRGWVPLTAEKTKVAPEPMPERGRY